MRLTGFVLTLAVAGFAQANVAQDVPRLLQQCTGVHFSSWDDHTLRSYLLERGIIAPGSSREKLVSLAQSDCSKLASHVQSATSSAKSYASQNFDAALSVASSLSSDATSLAATASDQASSVASSASSHAVKSRASAGSAAYEACLLYTSDAADE